MRGKPVVVELPDDLREQFCQLLTRRASEFSYQAEAGWDEWDPMLNAVKKRRAEEAAQDMQWVNDRRLPLTAARVERLVREIGLLPVCAFGYSKQAEAQIEDALAILQRLRFECRKARALAAEAKKAKAA